MKTLPETPTVRALSQRIATLTEAELSIYQTHERARQRRLLSTLLPPSTLLMGVGTVLFTVRLVLEPLGNHIIIVSYVALLLATTIFALGVLALRGGHLRLASIAMVSGGVAGLLLAVVLRILLQGLDPFGLSEFIALGGMIVLAGVLGGYRSIIATTLLVNAITLYVLLLAPRTPGLETLLRPQLPYLTPTAIILQWLFAAFLIANRASYLQTMSSLGNAVERARQLESLKDQFITHVNHELRTPIMTLQGYVEYLRETRQDMSPAEEAAAFDKASLTGKTLVMLLAEILDVRRIDEHQAVAPQAVLVREALAVALTLVDPRDGALQERDIRIQLPEDLAVWGDAVRVQQILTNLISNALKYSARGTAVEISAHVAENRRTLHIDRLLVSEPQQPPMVEITVRDYGWGIPPEQIPLLFNRFVRLPRDLASQVVGNGLGLYLCRVFAESMGGRIWAESTGIEGEGTSFHLLLPAPPTQDGVQEANVSVAPGARALS